MIEMSIKKLVQYGRTTGLKMRSTQETRSWKY